MEKIFFRLTFILIPLFLVLTAQSIVALNFENGISQKTIQRNEKEFYVSPNGNDSYPGTKEKPFRSIQTAVNKLTAGQTLILVSGTFNLKNSVTISKKGNEDAWITIRGEKNATVILDGIHYNIGNTGSYPGNKGLVQIENAEYVRVENIYVRNSHRAGINIQESKNIDIINCISENSLSPGIAAWQRCEYIRVLGNTVINANDMEMSWTPYKGSEAPHEAISMAGPHHFEVAYNHVYNCKKEGIDVKETASFGKVHHNYIHDCARQGLYIDGWFGQLQDIEMFDNVVHGCEAGIAVSSEDGPNTKNLKIHHNLVYNNRATGIFFSRWGADNPRENVEVYNNTFYQNGWGTNFSGDPQYWLSGGCYFYSTNLENVKIRNNIFSKNFPFEIGRTSLLTASMLKAKEIIIDYNLIQDINTTHFPIYLETWLKDSVFSISGTNTIKEDPLFENPEKGDFRLKKNSPAINSGHPAAEFNDRDGTRNDIGAFPAGTLEEDFWWKKSFPPVIDADAMNYF